MRAAGHDRVAQRRQETIEPRSTARSIRPGFGRSRHCRARSVGTRSVDRIEVHARPASPGSFALRGHIELAERAATEPAYHRGSRVPSPIFAIERSETSSSRRRCLQCLPPRLHDKPRCRACAPASMRPRIVAVSDSQRTTLHDVVRYLHGYSSSPPPNNPNCAGSRAGSARPRCRKACEVNSRPRGVRCR